MKKEHLLLALSIIASCAVGGMILRTLAPRLFGLPADLEVVQLSRKVPPFYENIFRKEDLEAEKLLVNDPLLLVRGRPLLPAVSGLGPHDLLGFRNFVIPSSADVITIGDSQTYGNNASLQQNWPSNLARELEPLGATLYNMAAGSWSALQYLNIAQKAIVFRPRAVVVAFYTGNDSLEAFRLAYSVDYWKPFRLDPALTIDDLPPVKFPAPESEHLTVTFQDGSSMGFIPSHRLAANDLSNKAARTGFEIMKKVGTELGSLSRHYNIKLFLTILPTKELVYSKIMEQDRVVQDSRLKKLIELETQNIGELQKSFAAVEGATYVDLIPALEQAALKDRRIYPSDFDGHPLAAGYAIIGKEIAKSITSAHLSFASTTPQSPVAVRE